MKPLEDSRQAHPARPTSRAMLVTTVAEGVLRIPVALATDLMNPRQCVSHSTGGRSYWQNALRSRELLQSHPSQHDHKSPRTAFGVGCRNQLATSPPRALAHRPRIEHVPL